MILETAKEQICMHQIIGEKKDIFNVESDVIVNDIKPDVLRVISTSGIVCINKKEKMNGKIKITGEINTYIIYLADDEKGSTRSLNAYLNFNQILDMPNLSDEVEAKIKLKLKKIETQVINGRKINIKAIVEGKTTLYLNGNMNIIKDIDKVSDMQVLKTKEQIISLLGEGNTRTNAKDTISIDETDEIAEIMKVDCNILDKEIKTSYNKVLIKAKTAVKIMYLTEDDKIKTISANIPIVGFVDMANVDENCIYNLEYAFKSIIIKPNNSEEHSIYFDAEIEFKLETYQIKEIDIIKDLYSTNENINFKSKTINTITSKVNLKETCIITENLQILELANGKICATEIVPNILKEDIKNNKIIYEGEVEVKIIYTNGKTIDSKNIIIPFKFEISSKFIKEGEKIITNIIVKDDKFVLLPNNMINIDMSLEFNLEIEENKEINLIEEINKEQCEDFQKYSMVIYFVKPGDTLWQIAKKFKSRVEDIKRVNNIEDANKVEAGAELYIPKSIKCNG